MYNYVYFAKGMNPFKTVGKYGFSHGGIAPQELITPYLCWSNEKTSLNNLNVKIINKKELTNVTGNLYQIKIEAKSSSNDIFSTERKNSMSFFTCFVNGITLRFLPFPFLM